MVLNCFNQLFFKGKAIAGGAKGAVAHMSSCAPGNLSCLRRHKIAHGAAVKFSARSKGNMINVHVKPHANRIGCHQIVNFAFLIKGGLGVAGARGECTKNNRRAAALTANKFGDGVNCV